MQRHDQHRRRLLGGLAAGLGVAALPRLGLASQADVVVIGAGLAGLNAALILADAGARVTVLEADQRAGGRVKAAGNIPGSPELGAAEVGPLYARVRDMARRLKVPLARRGDPVGAFALAVGDQLVRIEDWPESDLNLTVGDERAVPPPALLQVLLTRSNPLRRPDDWLRSESRQFDVSVHDWLASQGASAVALELINQGLITADARRTSVLPSFQDGLRMDLARSLAGSQPGGGVDNLVRGSSSLTDAMAEQLGDRLRLGCRVKAVDMSADGVAVRCADGSTYRGDFVVSAIPFPLLRQIDVQPVFAGPQAEAIASLRWADTTQVFLRQSAGDFWDEDGYPPSLWSDGPVNLYRQVKDSELIIAVLVGRKAELLRRLPTEQRGEFVQQDLLRLRPALRGRLKVLASHSWAEEPFVSGCRHDFAPGSVHRFVPAMFAAHERMHFAGEHTRLQEIGMESAMESGERAALEILAG